MSRRRDAICLSCAREAFLYRGLCRECAPLLYAQWEDCLKICGEDILEHFAHDTGKAPLDAPEEFERWCARQCGYKRAWIPAFMTGTAVSWCDPLEMQRRSVDRIFTVRMMRRWKIPVRDIASWLTLTRGRIHQMLTTRRLARQRPRVVALCALWFGDS